MLIPSLCCARSAVRCRYVRDIRHYVYVDEAEEPSFWELSRRAAEVGACVQRQESACARVCSPIFTCVLCLRCLAPQLGEVAVGYKNGLDAEVVLNPPNKSAPMTWDLDAMLIIIGDD